jgi:hypothetical protein
LTICYLAIREEFAMPIQRATRDQFDIEENAVVHRPMSARFAAYPGVAEPHQKTLGLLGSVLPNGDDYREHEVIQIARSLLVERLKTK